MQRARTIRQFGAAVVVMAFDEKGQADTFERKIEVCQRAFRSVSYTHLDVYKRQGEYDQTPAQMAREMRAFVDEGLVNIIGGCCGTTDEFISEFLSLVMDGKHFKKPHVPVAAAGHLSLSGLDVLEITPDKNFINVGERCNVAAVSYTHLDVYKRQCQFPTA